MKIDKGSPIDFNKEGSRRRLSKLDSIYPIQFNNALDYGAGIGAYSLLIAEKVKRTFSMDINKSFISSLQSMKIKNIDMLVASCESTCFNDDTFEALFAIEVLEHLDNLESGIKEIRRITKKDGIIYITVPNKYFPLETHHVYLFNKTIDGRFIPFLSMIDSVHSKIGSARRFSLKNLCSYFQCEGFEFIGSEYIMPPFDNFKKGRFIKPITDYIENSPLKILSSNIAVVFRNAGK